jgi:hypothetical protein
LIIRESAINKHGSGKAIVRGVKGEDTLDQGEQEVLLVAVVGSVVYGEEERVCRNEATTGC